jgi:hypothetical protein
LVRSSMLSFSRTKIELLARACTDRRVCGRRRKVELCVLRGTLQTLQSHARRRSRARAYTHMRTHARAHTHTHTQTQTQTQTHTRTHAHTTYTHTHKHTHVRTHTQHTHTHTHHLNQLVLNSIGLLQIGLLERAGARSDDEVTPFLAEPPHKAPILVHRVDDGCPALQVKSNECWPEPDVVHKRAFVRKCQDVACVRSYVRVRVSRAFVYVARCRVHS